MSLVSKFKKLGPKIFLLKILGFEPVFACAIRKKGDKALYDGDVSTPFELVPVDKSCWYADPLLYEHKGRTFLFMEAWGYRTRKGVIVCSEISERKVLKAKKVLEEDYHISFPNVFEFQNNLYMIPELEESGEIRLYRSIKFPGKWECVFEKKTDIPLIDCIVETIDGNDIYVKGSTFKEDNDMSTSFYHFKLHFDGMSFSYSDCDEKLNAIDMSLENRNAGRMILQDSNKGMHPVQRSTKSVYGYSLKFYESLLKENHWCDHEDSVVEITPESIKINGFKKKIIGTHTYSETSKYEVIDIEYFRWSPMNWVRQIIKRR